VAALGPVALLFVAWHVAVVASHSLIFPTPWQVAVGLVELGRRDSSSSTSWRRCFA
jgi:hypothetical protein